MSPRSPGMSALVAVRTFIASPGPATGQAGAPRSALRLCPRARPTVQVEGQDGSRHPTPRSAFGVAWRGRQTPGRLTLPAPVPRIADLYRTGPYCTPAPKTATYKHRAASCRRPGRLLGAHRAEEINEAWRPRVSS